MYLYATYEGREAKRFARLPVPAGAHWPELEERVEKIIHYASRFNDAGADHHQLVALDAVGQEIGHKKIEGY